jgi:hypothetical protein
MSYLQDLEATRDTIAVNKFAGAMDAKLAISRAKGRHGWQTCTVDYLWTLLREHVEKGDPVDIANLAMMIWHNSQEPDQPRCANSTADMDREEVKRTMVQRMCSGESFTFGGLWRPFGASQRQDGCDPYRLADKLIQVWRRKGRITFTRTGKTTVWRLTEIGREHARLIASGEVGYND